MKPMHLFLTVTTLGSLFFSRPVLALQSSTISRLEMKDMISLNHTFSTLNNKSVTLKDQHYPLLISVFTTWCAVCKVELKELNRIYLEEKTPSSSPSILVINAGESLKSIQKYVKKRDLSLPVVADLSLEFTKDMRILGTPAIFIFDKNKKLIYQGSELPEQWQTLLK